MRISFYLKTVAFCRFIRNATISLAKVVLSLLHIRIVQKTIARLFLQFTGILQLLFIIRSRTVSEEYVYFEKLFADLAPLKCCLCCLVASD